MSSLSSVRNAGGSDFSDLIRNVPQTYSKLMHMSKTKNRSFYGSLMSSSCEKGCLWLAGCELELKSGGDILCRPLKSHSNLDSQSKS